MKKLFGTSSSDPYLDGPEAITQTYLEKRIYTGTTLSNFRVRYSVSCFIHKVSFREFKAARMLDPGNFGRLVNEWHSQVFLPTLAKLGGFFRMLTTPYGPDTRLCRVKVIDGKVTLCSDPGCLETVGEIKAVPFRSNGCEVELHWMDILKDNDLIEENFNMIELKNRDILTESPETRLHEESMAVIMRHNLLKLEKEFQNVQRNQTHASKLLSVEVKQVSRAVEISWDFKDDQNGNFLLEGYRSEGGFSVG